MDKEKSSAESAWEISPPNTPLNMQWPALEKKIEKPAKKTNKPAGWRKYRKNKMRGVSQDPLKEAKYADPVGLDSSLILTPQEQAKAMQLISIFDGLEIGTIVSVLRGVNGDLDEAIDQLLVLADDLEKRNVESKVKENEGEDSESSSSFSKFDDAYESVEEDDDVLEEDYDVLEENGFEQLVEEEPEDLEDDWSERGCIKASQAEDDTKKSLRDSSEGECDGSAFGGFSMERYRILGEYIELPAVPVPDSELEKWLQEFDPSSFRHIRKQSTGSQPDLIECVDSTLVESLGSISCSYPLVGESSQLTDSIPALESIPEIDLKLISSPKISQKTEKPERVEESPVPHLALEPNSKFALEPTSRTTQLNPISKGLSLNDILIGVKSSSSITRTSSEPMKEFMEERPYFFALDDEKLESRMNNLDNKLSAQKKAERRQNAMLRRQEKKLLRQRAKLSRRLPPTLSKEVGTLTINQPLVSVGVDPKEQVETVTLAFHQQKVAELEAAKRQVEEEKKRAMSWCVEQMAQIRKQSEEKALFIESQNKQIEDQKLEIEALNNKLNEMLNQENKLQSLLTFSKDKISEGVQTLQKNITEGLAKVETDWVVLDKVREMDIVEKVKDLDILEKMKQLASSLKEEISLAFSKLEQSFEQSPPREEKNHEDETHEEEKQIWVAEKASLESYIAELHARIREFEAFQVPKEQKETQVEIIRTGVKGTNTDR